MKHQKLWLERCGLDGRAKTFSEIGVWGDWMSTVGGEQQWVEVCPEEATGEVGLFWPPAKVFSCGETDDGELEEVDKGRQVFFYWENTSCAALPSAVFGGNDWAEDYDGCQLRGRRDFEEVNVWCVGNVRKALSEDVSLLGSSQERTDGVVLSCWEFN